MSDWNYDYNHNADGTCKYPVTCEINGTHTVADAIVVHDYVTLMPETTPTVSPSLSPVEIAAVTGANEPSVINPCLTMLHDVLPYLSCWHGGSQHTWDEAKCPSREEAANRFRAWARANSFTPRRATAEDWWRDGERPQEPI